jgi:hypothetical protein
LSQRRSILHPNGLFLPLWDGGPPFEFAASGSGINNEIVYTFMNAPYQLQPIGKWTPEYLQELPPIELDWVDYKASAWLKIDSFPWDEISKYLSAYSNFDGGYLIIGATNRTPGKPVTI